MNGDTFDCRLAEIKKWVVEVESGGGNLSLFRQYEAKLKTLIQEANSVDREGFPLKMKDFHDAASALHKRMQNLKHPIPPDIEEQLQKAVLAKQFKK